MKAAQPCIAQWSLACRPAACKSKGIVRVPAPQPLAQRPLDASSLASPSARSLVMTAAQAQSASVKQEPTQHVLEVLRNADAVCFDVDSTLCDDESIDEIAAFLGVGEEVAALTAKAMGGTVLFQDALAERLNCMQVTRQDMEQYLAEHPPRFSPGIPELVRRLEDSGRRVYLVSGGFRQVIHPIAEMLGIPLANVFANRILFEEDGRYAGFDPEEFTSRSGGKAEAVRHICARDGLRRVVMVGDGATDLEARQPGGAEIFIGYGGSVYRPNIAEQADWYVMHIQEIINALEG